MALGEWKFALAGLGGGRPLLAAAGVWDDLGDLVVLRPGLVQAKFALYGTTWDSVDAALDLAKAGLFAGRGLLKVTVGDDGTATRQALARCVSLDVPYKFDTPRLVVCSAKFELLQPHWDSINLFSVDRSATTFTVDNAGSTCQTQRTLAIYLLGPVGSPDLVLANDTNSMIFTFDSSASPIPSGHWVTIDCGAMTVLYDDVSDRWQYLDIGDDQIGFMALEPGVNNFLKTAGYNITVAWYKSYL